MSPCLESQKPAGREPGGLGCGCRLLDPAPFRQSLPQAMTPSGVAARPYMWTSSGWRLRARLHAAPWVAGPAVDARRHQQVMASPRTCGRWIGWIEMWVS